MKQVTIQPGKLRGSLTVPPSKSEAHRLLICAGLAKGESRIENIDCSEDISATIAVLRALGSRVESDGDGFSCRASACDAVFSNCTLSCAESGSTLRFSIPIALAKGGSFLFTGRGRLLSRPLEPYYAICRRDGIAYEKTDQGIRFCGKLQGGNYELPGNISSQFISGLLFALPLLSCDSRITLTTALESEGYLRMTLRSLAQFGIRIDQPNEREFFIRGGQEYQANFCRAEGDYSQAAFFLAANALGNCVALSGLSPDSLQGDREILRILEAMGQPLSALALDVSQIPDLVPILTVLATQAEGTTRLYNAARLRLKESDRLHTITEELRKLGADITEKKDELIIHGKTPLCGAVCDAHNDHRIAMSLAIASTVASGEITILGADCVKKSYGGFWKDFEMLGGTVHGE